MSFWDWYPPWIRGPSSFSASEEKKNPVIYYPLSLQYDPTMSVWQLNNSACIGFTGSASSGLNGGQYMLWMNLSTGPTGSPSTGSFMFSSPSGMTIWNSGTTPFVVGSGGGTQGVTGPTGPSAGPAGPTGPTGLGVPTGVSYGDYMIWNGSSAWITNNSIAGGAASVVLGQGAGLAGGLSVNVGGLAGALTTSGGQSINIGYGAGENNNATGAVNVGYDAGHAGAGVGSVAVGQNAGAGNYPSIALGKYAVALGALADANTGAANSICINASGVALDAMLPSAMYVKPIRQPASAASNLLTWNPTTSEVVASSGTVGALTGDYLLWNSSTSSYVSNETLTNPSAVVIGAGAGSTSSPSGSIQIGAGANNSSLAVNGISIGHQAGSSLSTQYSILIGALANCTGSTVLAQLYIGSPVTPMQSINIGPFQYYTSPNVTVLYSGVTTQFGSIYLPINGTQISGTLTISTYSVPNVGEVISSTQQQLFAFANYNGTLTSSLSLLSAVATSGQSAPTLSLSTSGTTYILSINWSTVNSTGYEVQFLIASANPSGVVISSP